MRTIQTCNFCLLKEGVIHPERVLQQHHDLVYLMEGGWEIWEENNCYRLKPGDMLFLHSGRRHYGKVKCLPNTRTMFIHFDKLPEDTFSSQNRTFGWSDTVMIDTLTHCQNNPFISDLCKDIIYNFFSGAHNIQIKLFSQLVELFYELSTLSSSNKNNLVQDELVSEIIFRISANPHINYTVSSLANEFYICESTLSKRFKRATNVSIYQYQLTKKLEMARSAIISEQKLPLREIATMFGFCDEFHFSKLFKKKYEYSPSQYRKNNLELLHIENNPVCAGLLSRPSYYNKSKLHTSLDTTLPMSLN